MTALRKIFERTFDIIHRNVVQVTFVTFIIAAVESAYVCLVYIVACIFIPELSLPKWTIDILPKHYTPEVIITIAVCVVFGYMIVTPLSYGVDWCFYHASKGLPIPLECLYTCILNKERRRKVWIINIIAIGSRMLTIIAAAALLRTFRLGLWQLDELNAEAEIYVVMYGIMVVLLLLIGAFYLMLTARYFLVPYVFAERPDESVRKLLLEAVRMTNGSKLKILSLKTLMLPVFSLNVLGFPVLLTIPFSRSVYASFALSLYEKGSRDKEEDEFKYQYII